MKMTFRHTEALANDLNGDLPKNVAASCRQPAFFLLVLRCCNNSLVNYYLVSIRHVRLSISRSHLWVLYFITCVGRIVRCQLEGCHKFVDPYR